MKALLDEHGFRSNYSQVLSWYQSRIKDTHLDLWPNPILNLVPLLVQWLSVPLSLTHHTHNRSRLFSLCPTWTRTSILNYPKATSWLGELKSSFTSKVRTPMDSSMARLSLLLKQFPTHLLLLELLPLLSTGIPCLESKGSNDPQCSHLHTHRALRCACGWSRHFFSSLDNPHHYVCISIPCSSYANLFPGCYC